MTNALNNILLNLHNFDDVYTHVKNKTKKEKGDVFEEITKYLFLLHPNYKNDTKNIYLYKDIPINLKKKLNIPNKDKGIDLVWETYDGDYYAIQCKFRMNVDETIPWADLSTFVGMTHGIADGFKQGIYVTNTYSIDEEIERSNKILTVCGEFFDEDHFPTDFFDHVRQYVNNKKIQYIPSKPRDYQQKIIDDVVEYYKTEDRGHLVMACGSGKTLTSYWINKEMNNNLTLILVPSLHLLSQFYSDWIKQSVADNMPTKFLLIGSDADFGEENIKDKYGLMIMLEPDEIMNKIKQYKSGKLTIISTYQSSNLLPLIAKKLKLTFDLCIFDEAHKTVGQKNTQFSLLLNNDKMKITKRLFMTATPRIYKTDDDHDEHMLSMDDEEWYGSEIASYSIRDAIKHNPPYLSEYQIVTMHTTDKYIEEFIATNKFVKLANTNLTSHELMCAIMIYKGFTTLDCNHMLTYHANIKKSKEFVQLLDELFKFMKLDVHVQHMDGTMSMKARKAIERDFTRSKKAIICSARVLNEGVNIPIVDSECFIDPRQSTIDIVQCVGRALRLHESKNMAKILVPYKCNNINDLETDKSVYGQLVTIVKSLYDRDDNIVDYFNKRDRGTNVNKNGKNKNKEIIRYISFVDVHNKIKLGEWIDKLDMVVHKKVDSFDYMYQLVVEWIEKNNRIPSEESKNLIEKQYGKWCSHQRQNKKKNMLLDNQFAKLDEIDIWYWSLEGKWNKNYDRIKGWIEKNNKIPSAMSKDQVEKKYGAWCNKQRRNKKNTQLSYEQLAKLDEIDIWYWGSDETKEVKSWDNNYNDVKKWIEENNKLPSAMSKDQEEKKYGKWCGCQRQNKKKNKLSDEKITKLDEIDIWYWEKEDPWDENYNDAKKWIEENNKIPSAMSKDLTERKYGDWCGRQRKNKKKNMLSDDQLAKLDGIDIWYSSSDEVREHKSWNENYNDVKEWIIKNKMLPFEKSKDGIEKKYGQWCSQQRSSKKKHKLSDDQIAKLDEINDWYWRSDEVREIKSWDEQYNSVKKWIEGTNKIPSAISKDPIEKKYGSWCHHQRQTKKNNKLSFDSINKLELIPHWYWIKDQPLPPKSISTLKYLLDADKELTNQLTATETQYKQITGKIVPPEPDDSIWVGSVVLKQNIQYTSEGDSDDPSKEFLEEEIDIEDATEVKKWNKRRKHKKSTKNMI